MPCVLLRVGGGSYALAMADVAEVVPGSVITRVPGLPAWLPGLTGWRGRLLAVADLNRLFDSGDEGAADVVVVVRRGELELGLACTDVSGTVDIDAADLVPAPSVAATAVASLLTGTVVSDGVGIGVLDTGALFGLRERLPARDVR